MRKFLSLCFVLSIITLVQAQNPNTNIDPYVKTYITDTKYRPDAEKQNALKAESAWHNFIAANGKWNVEFNELSGKPFRAFGKGIATEGTTIEERAMHFIQNTIQDFTPEANEYVLQSITTSKYHYINYTQQFEGLDVLFSKATLRMTTSDYKIILFGLETFADINVNTTPAINSDAAANFASADFAITVNSSTTQPELSILPVPKSDNSGYTYKLVYTVYVKTTDYNNIPGNYYTLVDAHSGEVLYRQNDVKACGAFLMDANASIEATITDNPLQPTEVRGLPYIRVTIDGVYYFADENGVLNLDFITEATEAIVSLRGTYGQVFEGEAGMDMETATVTLLPGDNYISFDSSSTATSREVSAYYHQTIVHDHAKDLYPLFSSLDFAQAIRVDRTDGECNAYYDGSSINFFAEGSGCQASALFNDVVYHEYGHAINENLYSFLGDFSGMNNGAMGEGYADIWAYTITAYPIIAQGWNFSSSSNIRRYDLGPKYYPDDIIGEVHNDGEIIAGAWWDLYENFDYDLDAMVAIWVESQYGTPDGPSGTEGTIYTSVLIEALLADDDNDDPTDGTPNMDLILDAFAEHGIFILGDVRIEHIESITSLSPTETVIMYANLITEFPLYAGSFKIYYRTDISSPFSSAGMYALTEGSYFSNLGEFSPGTVIEYYFQANDIFGNHAADAPLKVGTGDPNLSYFALVGFSEKAIEDFDSFMGSWIVNPLGDDDAITGEWVIANTIQTQDIGGVVVQPGYDHTLGSSNICAVTGNESGPMNVNDVDEGKTTLQSPNFDVTELLDPVFTYYRWFSNDAPTASNKGNDPWRVYISNNGTDWVNVENTFTSDNSWRKNAIRIKDYVEPSTMVSLLFIAQDSILPELPSNGQSTVEAAIDDLQLWDVDLSSAVNNLNGEATLNIYPNPVSNILMLNTGNFSGNTTIKIYNALGEMVHSESRDLISNNIYSLQVQKLDAGIYLLELYNDNGFASSRFVRENP
ncbi:MAG: T9SS type A sorting domain-containing protein [Bacteroidetes bacterium]|nr:T9SS type A sorting domain-containing protein [Bacteroidota bacterium]